MGRPNRRSVSPRRLLGAPARLFRPFTEKRAPAVGFLDVELATRGILDVRSLLDGAPSDASGHALNRSHRRAPTDQNRNPAIVKREMAHKSCRVV
jgi:hypothetical protein